MPDLSPKISADLLVDGSAFQPTTCESGQPHSFAGVDLIDHGGRKLRLVQDPSLRPSAILISGSQAIEFGECGTMRLERQNSRVNRINLVRGEATLDCEAQGRTVEGSVTFANCH